VRHHARLILVLVALAAALATSVAAQEPPVRATGQGLQFDFQDADLRLVLAALGEAGRLNLVYSQLPDRRVTLRTNQPVPADQILPLLKSLAASNGLKVTEDGSFIRIEDAGPREARPAPQKDTTAKPELRLFVYRLKHARAAKLAGTLQSIFGGGSRQLAQATPGPTLLSEELRRQQVPPTDVAQPPQVSVQLRPTPPPSLPGQLRGEVHIVPDEATNSLLVRAQQEDWEVLRQSIATLDLRPLQVLIEVLIAEVRHTKDFQLGVSGRLGDDSTAVGNATSATLTGATAGDFVLRVMRVGRVDVDLALSALSATGKVRILSRPVLLAQNNQEARILIGSERPFVQVFRSLPTDAAVRDQVVQYRDVGTQLTLTPTINEDGYVNLQLAQQVSNATSEVQFGAPIISTREAATHLFVRDGQTVVVGGLIDREEDRSRSGIPVLKDIPLLGALFGSTRRADTRNELFVFLTPHIVATDEDAERVREGVGRGAELLRPTLPTRPLIDSMRPRRDSTPTRRDSTPR
jgi:general secretion pathway protein D